MCARCGRCRGVGARPALGGAEWLARHGALPCCPHGRTRGFAGGARRALLVRAGWLGPWRAPSVLRSARPPLSPLFWTVARSQWRPVPPPRLKVVAASFLIGVGGEAREKACLCRRAGGHCCHLTHTSLPLRFSSSSFFPPSPFSSSFSRCLSRRDSCYLLFLGLPLLSVVRSFFLPPRMQACGGARWVARCGGCPESTGRLADAQSATCLIVRNHFSFWWRFVARAPVVWEHSRCARARGATVHFDIRHVSGGRTGAVASRSACPQHHESMASPPPQSVLRRGLGHAHSFPMDRSDALETPWRL